MLILVERGLDVKTYRELGYRMLGAQGRSKIAESLWHEFGQEILTVPGIYIAEKDGRRYLTIAGKAGLVIPVRDVNGLIVALKIRANDETGGNRYTYLSSKSKGGPGPGSHCHVPIGVSIGLPELRITEGELKADVATEQSGIPTVSIPGVKSWRFVLPVLESLKPKSVLLALDADCSTNKDVATALGELAEALLERGYTAILERWDASKGKGIDDLLLKGEQPERVTGDDLLPAIAEIRKAAGVGKGGVGKGGVSNRQSERGESQELPGMKRPPGDSAAAPDGWPDDSLLLPENQTDAKLSVRFARTHGESLKYVSEWGKWIRWTGLQWVTDRTGQEIQFAKRFAEGIWREADAAEFVESGPDGDQTVSPLEHLAKRVSSKKGLCDLVMLSKSEPDMIISSDALDKSPALFNVLNGTIDLRTGELRPHRSDDLITKLCPLRFDPDATCPRWEEFVYQVMGGDVDLFQFLQEWFGYCMTGETKEQVFVILYGDGSNGKSVTVNTMLKTFGDDYGNQAPSTLLLEKKHAEHPTILASLFGRRLVACSETGDGARFNEALVKQLTGTDPISARLMYQDFWDFLPTHKLVLLTNHKPTIRGADAGIWRRIILIPFVQHFWNPAAGETGREEFRQDKDLPAKLVDEAPGILNWLVSGARHWYSNGLHVPAAARAAVEEYRKGEDVIQRFIDEACVTTGSPRVKSSELYKAYKQWCIDGGEHEMTATKFGKLMTARGFMKDASNGVRYIGIGLASHERPELPATERQSTLDGFT